MTENPDLQKKKEPFRFSATNQPKRRRYAAPVPLELQGREQIPRAALKAMTNRFLSMEYKELEKDIYRNEKAPAVYRLIAGLIIKAVQTSDVARSKFLLELCEEDKDLNKYLQTVNANTREQVLEKARAAIKQLEGEIAEEKSGNDRKLD